MNRLLLSFEILFNISWFYELYVIILVAGFRIYDNIMPLIAPLFSL